MADKFQGAADAVLARVEVKAPGASAEELAYLAVAAKSTGRQVGGAIDAVLTQVEASAPGSDPESLAYLSSALKNLGNAPAVDPVPEPDAEYPIFELGEPISIDKKGTWIEGEQWDEHTTYCRTHQYSKGQFGISSNTFDDRVQMKCRMRIMPFQVHQQTGVITLGTPGYGYQNNGGYRHSTQAFGFAGNVGFAWGNNPWGSNNTHYQGGCSWRVNNNNTVTTGSHTGNESRTKNSYASNYRLAAYAYNGKVYVVIPTYHSSTKKPIFAPWVLIESSSAANTWPALDNGYTPSDATNTQSCQVWPCMGREIGESLPGVLCYTAADGVKLQAMSKTGGSYLGPSIDYAGSVAPAGPGFELSNGKRLFISHYGCYVVDSTGIKAIDGPQVALKDYGLYGPKTYNSLSGNTGCTGGYPAKEQDTWYVLIENYKYAKIRIDPNTYEVTVLGAIQFSGYDLRSTDGLIDVTGDDDRFILTSHRPSAYGPNYTAVHHNPLKDL